MTSSTTPLRGGAIAAICLATVLAGCSGTDSTDTDSRPAKAAAGKPRPVVDRATAEQILDTYQDKNNKANKMAGKNRLGAAKVLHQIETGTLLQQSLAGHELLPYTSAEHQRKSKKPFVYTGRRWLIPPRGEANWFAVIATPTTPGSKPVGDEQLLIVRKDDKDEAGEPYKLAASVSLDGTRPDIPLDSHGLVRTADPDARVGRSSVSAAVPATLDLITDGGTRTSFDWASSDAKDVMVNTYRTRNDAKCVTRRFAESSTVTHELATYAMQTKDGVLAVYDIGFTENQKIDTDSGKFNCAGAYLKREGGDPAVQAFADGAFFRSLQLDHLAQAAADLPAQGKPTLLSIDNRFTGGTSHR